MPPSSVELVLQILLCCVPARLLRQLCDCVVGCMVWSAAAVCWVRRTPNLGMQASDAAACFPLGSLRDARQACSVERLGATSWKELRLGQCESKAWGLLAHTD